MKKAAFEQYIGHGDFALCSNLILGINRSISVVLLFVLAAYKSHNEEKKRGSLHSMQQSAALGCGRHEALMQQILTPVRGLNWCPGIRFLVCLNSRKPRIFKENWAENAKPSQSFLIGFLEVSGGLRRDKGIQQALIETNEHAKNLGKSTFPGFFHARKSLMGYPRFWRILTEIL